MNFEELKKFYNGKRVLLTGHTGFKGSWLSKILIMCGAKLTGYALNPPTDTNIFDILNKNYELVEGVEENGGYHAQLQIGKLFTHQKLDENTLLKK